MLSLEINNKSRKLVWGTGCFEDCCDRLGLTLNELDGLFAENERKFLNEITFSALRNGAEIDDDDFDLNYKQFVFWLDNAPQETGQEIMKDYLSSKFLGKTMQDYYDDIIARFNAADTDVSNTTVKKKRSRSVKS